MNMEAGGFSRDAFERKVAEINISQDCIEGLSAWLMYHRTHYNEIVRLWCKEFQKVREPWKRLAFVYLANDVIQRSTTTGGEFRMAFEPILKKVCGHMAELSDEKTKRSILRLLKIWKDRNIYNAGFLRDVESSYLKDWNALHDGKAHQGMDRKSKRSVSEGSHGNVTNKRIKSEKDE